MNNLECRHLCKTYTDGKLKVEVLTDVNLQVLPGEMIAIVGASGSGKSTLLHLLGGLDTPSSGEVIVAGENLAQLSENAKSHLRNCNLGFVYQFHHLLPEFNALENVCMPLLIRGLKSAETINRAREMIDLVGLTARAEHRVGELSGGERQRIAIARALVTKPLCVLADEPTGNLDQTSAEHIYALMQQLNQSLKTSFVIVTHNLQFAAQMHRQLVLQKGILA
jgi:lipoprotein-releasing system ATP-binding protein